MKKPPYKIETVYRVRIDFDAQDWASVSDGLLKIGKKLDDCEVFPGGPCYFPYVTAEHRSKAAIVRYVEKAVRYIRRRKDGRINP